MNATSLTNGSVKASLNRQEDCYVTKKVTALLENIDSFAKINLVAQEISYQIKKKKLRN